MDEVEAGVGEEGEEGIGEGVVMAIKVVMEITKLDMGITRVAMEIIKVWILNTYLQYFGCSELLFLDVHMYFLFS